jgi:hypothetical protein
MWSFDIRVLHLQVAKKLKVHWKMYLKIIYSSFGFYSFSLSLVIVEFSEISFA